jgi:hypothetical protein
VKYSLKLVLATEAVGSDWKFTAQKVNNLFWTRTIPKRNNTKVPVRA